MLSARQLGAEQIVVMGRHLDRTDLGREFGATDAVAERGDEIWLPCPPVSARAFAMPSIPGHPGQNARPTVRGDPLPAVDQKRDRVN